MSSDTCYDGTWYNEGGISIDVDDGIEIAATGDAAIKIYGADHLLFYNEDNNYRGVIHAVGDNLRILSAGSKDILINAVNGVVEIVADEGIDMNLSDHLRLPNWSGSGTPGVSQSGAGSMVYSTTYDRLYVYSGSAWGYIGITFSDPIEHALEKLLWFWHLIKWHSQDIWRRYHGREETGRG